MVCGLLNLHEKSNKQGDVRLVLRSRLQDYSMTQSPYRQFLVSFGMHELMSRDH